MKELEKLNERLINEGCNAFYIEGIGQRFLDDVECLGFNGMFWEVYYTERGKKSDPIFTTLDQELAIETYYKRITRYEHWHIIAFTRSDEVFKKYTDKLANHQIRIVQNDIPDYATAGDRVYRLFVVNKDIFKARELFDVIPYYDGNLKH